MKHFLKYALLTAFAVAGSAYAFAQPKLCGHRGSIWGVENTAEAFINGAKIGYSYLECDVKVTKDGVHVISHDDTTNRLGGSLTIASSTLEQLKAETYTQTRGGVTYTGTICTLAEYLDICTEQGVHPLIELKWATGINSNDTSGIPALISLIESKGHRNDCIILTSMKPCLEYIRKKYPDITLQFLTGQYWESHFEWCVKWGIDADIEAGYFDKSTVQRYHDNGLKVGMWTVDTESGYKTYGNYGCDFITTNKLDPATLPELDESITFPPNSIDYPVTPDVVNGFYNFDANDMKVLDKSLTAADLSRAIFRDGYMYVLLNADSPQADIVVVNTSTGTRATSPALPENANPRAIAFAADGSLIASDISSSSLRLFRWANITASPEMLAEIPISSLPVEQIGSHFAISGRADDLYVYLSCTADSKPSLIGFNIHRGNLSGTPVVGNLDSELSPRQIIVTPANRFNLLVNYIDRTADENTVNLDKLTFSNYSSANPDLFDNNSPTVFLRYGQKPYAVGVSTIDGTNHIRLLDVSRRVRQAFAVSRNLTAEGLSETITAVGADVAKGKIVIYAVTDMGSLYTFTSTDVPYDGEGENTGETDFLLEKVWELSTVTGNAPSNLGGDSARQGAVVNGKFYVNDRNDKKVRVFDENGLIDSFDGGGGWGTAADDAGNLIVRDDALTSSTHTFLIYPAGNFSASPRRVEIDCRLDGQTDFISASGNVENGLGYIYLFPKGHESVAAIRFIDGSPEVMIYPDLALTGSAAGYVIPIRNNAENWIYQVRTTGYYAFAGGESSQFLLGRASTTQPARNSTGGGCLFRLSARQIFVHPSGANYKGGFSVRCMDDDSVIGSVAPIGTLGYETGGNYSTFTWLFASRVDAGTFLIYNYCPANGFCVYRLSDRNYLGSVEGVAADCQVVATTYYNLQGIRVSHPDNLMPVIRVDTLADGSIRSSKVFCH